MYAVFFLFTEAWATVPLNNRYKDNIFISVTRITRIDRSDRVIRANVNTSCRKKTRPVSLKKLFSSRIPRTRTQKRSQEHKCEFRSALHPFIFDKTRDARNFHRKRNVPGLFRLRTISSHRDKRRIIGVWLTRAVHCTYNTGTDLIFNWDLYTRLIVLRVCVMEKKIHPRNAGVFYDRWQREARIMHHIDSRSKL